MKSIRFRVRAALVLLLAAEACCLLLDPAVDWGKLFPKRPAAPAEVSVTKHGLKLTVESAKREGDQLRVAYSFEWVEAEPGDAHFCFLRAWINFDLLFFDSAGNLVDEGRTDLLVIPSFSRKHDGTFKVAIP